MAKRTAENYAYHNMLARCRNPAHPAFRNYGARGIAVCDRWASSFDAFVADMGLRPSAAHSLDRIDVNGDYEPANCRWVTRVVQRRNSRNVRPVIDSTGRVFECMRDAANAVGRDETAIKQAIRKGSKCAGLNWRFT